MNRIPKKAQRAIEAANRARAARTFELGNRIFSQLIPGRLEVGKTPDNVLALFDVYLDGVQQFLCRVADAQQGFVIRWTYGKGRKPGKGAILETIQGQVEIRRKG